VHEKASNETRSLFFSCFFAMSMNNCALCVSAIEFTVGDYYLPWVTSIPSWVITISHWLLFGISGKSYFCREKNGPIDKASFPSNQSKPTGSLLINFYVSLDFYPVVPNETPAKLSLLLEYRKVSRGDDNTLMCVQKRKGP